MASKQYQFRCLLAAKCPEPVDGIILDDRCGGQVLAEVADVTKDYGPKPVNGVKVDDRCGGQVLEEVADVTIDHGRFKYVLLRISSAQKPAESKLVVRGYRRADYHDNIFQAVSRSLGDAYKVSTASVCFYLLPR